MSVDKKDNHIISFLNHPKITFAISFGVSVAVLVVLLILWKRYSSETIEAVGVGIQAIVGTAVIGAGAIAAIIIAWAAWITSEEAGKTADLARKTADLAQKEASPDYKMAKDALRAYQKLSFLTGSLMPAYRLWKQQTDRAAYASLSMRSSATTPACAQEANEGASPVGSDTTLKAPINAILAWQEILRQLRELFSDASLICALYEGAKLIDSTAATVDGESEEQRLRKTFTGMATAIFTDEARSTNRDVDHDYLKVVASTFLLAEAMRKGIAKGRSIFANGESAEVNSINYPLMRYLVDWWDQIPLFEETDISLFDNVARTSFSDFVYGNGHTHDLKYNIDSLLSKILYNDDVTRDPMYEQTSGCGIHEGLLVATLDGDESTVMSVEKIVEAYARSKGLTPKRVIVTSRFDLRRYGCNDKTLWILTCTRSTMHWLFAEGVLHSDTKACVILDGLRAPRLKEVEDFFVTPPELLDAIAEKQNQVTRSELYGDRGSEAYRRLRTELYNLRSQLRDRPRILDVVRLCAQWAASHNFNGANREDADLSAAIHPCSKVANSTLGAGPRVAWIGIDYREIGKEPPTRLGADFACELWAIFQREGQCLGIDAAALTRLGATARTKDSFDTIGDDIDKGFSVAR